MTLARDIAPDRIGEAVVAVLEIFEPFQAVLDRIALLHTKLSNDNWTGKELYRAAL